MTVKTHAVFAVILFFTLCSAFVLMADSQAAPVNVSVQAQVDNLNSRIKSVNDELNSLYSQEYVLKDQISILKIQKRMGLLDMKNREMALKLADAQRRNDQIKISDLNQKINLAAQVIPIYQDILPLYGRLEDAHKNAEFDLAKVIEEQIKAKKEEIKALQPEKPSEMQAKAPADSSGADAKPTPRPEASDVQALLDQISPIEDQIGRDRFTLDGLKKQIDVLIPQPVTATASPRFVTPAVSPQPVTSAASK